MSSNSKTDKKILFSLSGYRNKASSRVRGFWIAEELEKFGVHCTLRWDDSKLGLVRLAIEISKHDAIIFQKTYSRYHRWLMAYANWLGKKTYIDFDDTPSKTNSAVTLNNIEAMMQIADGVFVGSQNLFDYACQYQENTHLIPSGIKLSNYPFVEEKPENCVVCLGWIGNGAHYTDDLIDILEVPLKELSAKYRLRFKIVGACGVQKLYEVFGAIPGVDIDFIDTLEWSDPSVVSEAIKDFDIGLYPLLLNDSNSYKCGFKALEYMAIGIPVVSSPVAVNPDIITDGVDGFLAEKEEEWVVKITQLIENPVLRRDMGLAGRRKIEKSFNVKMISNQIKSILE